MRHRPQRWWRVNGTFPPCAPTRERAAPRRKGDREPVSRTDRFGQGIRCPDHGRTVTQYTARVAWKKYRRESRQLGNRWTGRKSALHIERPWNRPRLPACACSAGPSVIRTPGIAIRMPLGFLAGAMLLVTNANEITRIQKTAPNHAPNGMGSRYPDSPTIGHIRPIVGEMSDEGVI